MAKKECKHGYKYDPEKNICVIKTKKEPMTGANKAVVAARIAAAGLSAGLSELAFLAAGKSLEPWTDRKDTKEHVVKKKRKKSKTTLPSSRGIPK